MYPILFAPIYKEIIWGGTRMAERYDRVLPSDRVGESWDVSCRDEEMSVVENGAWAGMTLGELIARDKSGILGADLLAVEKFPLLLKIIDARDKLSVQVHPDDEYARRVENLPFGKTEMWYILDAPADAKLIIGLADGVTKDAFRTAIANGTVEDCLGYLPIAPGDSIFIQAGLLHAITSGVMLAEIQQNSDTTYRVYDFNRLGFDGNPRPLHVEKSLDVTDFEGIIRKTTVPGLTVSGENMDVTYTIACPYFAMERLALHGTEDCATDGERFILLTCTEGTAAVSAPGGTVALTAGQTVFLPAALGAYTLSGNATVLKSYVPKSPAAFRAVLEAAGFTAAEIKNNTVIVLE